MAPDTDVIALTDAADVDVAYLGGKAAALARLDAAGFPVPPGFVVTGAALELSDQQLRAAVDAAVRAQPELGPGPFAVRSSAVAEDTADASYAGLYETFLDVPRDRLAEAIRRCHAAAASARIAAYQATRATDPTGAGAGAGKRTRDGGSGMAVLVQPMVPADAAGVAFTANPVTGDRAETVVTAVLGVGERLVSGDAVGDEWLVRGDVAERHRGIEDAITAPQATAVADLARGVAAHFNVPQDIEWAVAGDRLALLQARPMTALPDPVDWTPPGSGLWQRNFRLGEWLPEPMTPLFADWLLPRIEDGYLAGMRTTVGTTIPFRYAAINGWYYNAVPSPSPMLLARALWESRGRIVPVLYNALVRVSRDPVAADRALLAGLYRRWCDEPLPRYRRLVADAEAHLDHADTTRLCQIVDELAHAAGEQLWALAIVGGSAWKIEASLARFCRDHLDTVLGGNVQPLLRGLPGITPGLSSHAVHSLDWYRPTAGEHPTYEDRAADAVARLDRIAAERETAEAACRMALAARPRLLRRFDALLEVAQRYATIREEQALDLTLAWPALRRCAHRLGAHLTAAGVTEAVDDVYFLTRADLDATTAHGDDVARRRASWERQCRLAAPLTLGTPPRLTGDPIARAVETARGTATVPAGAITGHPASAGRATGPVHRIDGPDDFAAFHDGEILLARATAPAWTPLFAHAAAVVTDGGTLAAHASLIAREYGIPAVVGTGDATTRLTDGQIVTVDGTTGIITATDRI